MSLNLKALMQSLLLLPVFFAFSGICATPDYNELKADLDSGGIKRRQAIWYVYQHNQFELLPYIADYLDKKPATRIEQLAVLHTMKSYQDNLERYLPNWPEILDRYIEKKLPEDNLIQAISIINYFKENKLIHALLRLTDDTRRNIRLACFRAIDNLGNDRLIPYLLKMAHHKRAIFRLYSLEAMTEFRDKRLLPTIQQSLIDESKSVRIYSILALAKQQSSQNINYNASNQFSREKNPEVRRRVIEVLRNENWKNLIYLVHRGINDSSDDVRKESLLAVQKFNNRSAASFISRQLQTEKNKELLELQLDTLCYLKSSGRGNGLKMILKNHEDFRLRARAAFSMGYLKDHSGISTLRDSVIFDKSVETRIESAWALGNFKDGMASQILQKTIRNKQEDYRVRSAAVLALNRQNTFQSKRLLSEVADLIESNHFSNQIQKLIHTSRR